MLRLLTTRLATTIPVLLVVSVATFGLAHLVPGDPAVTLAGDTPSEARVEQIRELMGLDRPLVDQYFSWFGGVIRGDLGNSLFKNRPVRDLIVERIPVTLSLTFFAVAIALLIAVPAGLLAGTRRGRFADRAVTIGTSAGVALPSYFVALLLVMLFSLKLGLLPASGYRSTERGVWEWARHLVLPGVALGLAMSAEIARQLRGAVIDVLDRDYVRTARAKGLRARVVLLKHVLRNASLPPITVLGLQVAHLLGGTVVIEQVFAIPGLGSLAIDGVMQRDMPIVQGVVMVAVLIVVCTNILVDLSYGWLNPRSRVS